MWEMKTDKGTKYLDADQIRDGFGRASVFILALGEGDYLEFPGEGDEVITVTRMKPFLPHEDVLA